MGVSDVAGPEPKCHNPTAMVRSAYDRVALEYYTEARKTSRNFDAVTVQALNQLDVVTPGGMVLDVGSGRGRCSEFLGVEPESIVQLDSSVTMLTLKQREPSALRVHQYAEQLPFPDDEFACVAGFLCDPFLGLSFLAEAKRVLEPGGLLIGTTPSISWGQPLREELGLDLMTTRFVLADGVYHEAPSHLYTAEQFGEMLAVSGFAPEYVSISEHSLPRAVGDVSPDIIRSSDLQGMDSYEISVLMIFTARA